MHFNRAKIKNVLCLTPKSHFTKYESNTFLLRGIKQLMVLLVALFKIVSLVKYT